ncbi:MAG: nucleotidyltransferase [Candidatus Scalindua sp.]|nr:nucleotidyltransferase [Candidatus Scalindua sp.]
MKDEEIRWKQRFQNFEKACNKLENVLGFYIKEPENELYQMALVQSFEFTFELGWKTLKDYLSYSGIKKISLPRDVIKQGFHHHIIEDGQMWIKMMEDRNLMAHTYSEKNAQKAVTKISQEYHNGIKQLYNFFKSKMEGN